MDFVTEDMARRHGGWLATVYDCWRSDPSACPELTPLGRDALRLVAYFEFETPSCGSHVLQYLRENATALAYLASPAIPPCLTEIEADEAFRAISYQASPLWLSRWWMHHFPKECPTDGIFWETMCDHAGVAYLEWLAGRTQATQNPHIMRRCALKALFYGNIEILNWAFGFAGPEKLAVEYANPRWWKYSLEKNMAIFEWMWCHATFSPQVAQAMFSVVCVKAPFHDVQIVHERLMTHNQSSPVHLGPLVWKNVMKHHKSKVLAWLGKSFSCTRGLPPPDYSVFRAWSQGDPEKVRRALIDSPPPATLALDMWQRFSLSCIEGSLDMAQAWCETDWMKLCFTRKRRREMWTELFWMLCDAYLDSEEFLDWYLLAYNKQVELPRVDFPLWKALAFAANHDDEDKVLARFQLLYDRLGGTTQVDKDDNDDDESKQIVRRVTGQMGHLRAAMWCIDTFPAWAQSPGFYGFVESWCAEFAEAEHLREAQALRDRILKNCSVVCGCCVASTGEEEEQGHNHQGYEAMVCDSPTH